MKKIVSLISIMLLNFCAGFSQNSNWIIGNSSRLDFNTNPPSEVSISNENGTNLPTSTSGYTSVSDGCGKLLFVTDGHKAWTYYNGSYIECSDTFAGMPRTDITQNVAIVPRPGHLNNFYIMTVTNTGVYCTDFYVATNGYSGHVVSSFILDSTNGFPDFQCTALTANVQRYFGSYTVFKHRIMLYNQMDNSLYTYYIEEDGIDIGSESSSSLSEYISDDSYVNNFAAIGIGTADGFAFSTNLGDLVFFNLYNYATNAPAFLALPDIGSVVTSLCFSSEYTYPFSLYVGTIDALHVMNYNGGATLFNSPDVLEYGNIGDLQLGNDGKIYGALINQSELLQIDELTQSINYIPLGFVNSSSHLGQSVTRNPNLPYLNFTKAIFNPIGPFCYGTDQTLPTTSANGITGTWSPAYNKNTSLTYTFTPTAGQCPITTTMTITVNPKTTPTFNVAMLYCSGAAISPLPTTSTNGVTGTWSPPLSNTVSKTYTFTPTAGLCANTATITIGIITNGTPTFDAVAPICSGDALSPLPTVSTNGIGGTWSPDLNNQETTTYTFTPDEGFCATTKTLVITVNPAIIPTFTPKVPIVSGTTLTLPTTSTNGISGTWMPPVNNVATTTYTFTPTQGICATATTLKVEVIGYNYNPISQVPVNYPGGTINTDTNKYFTDTKGELSISSSGTATYNLPIALPPSIKNVAPVINLTYTSGSRGGIAGQGWHINSISTICRMATRRDIDGFVDGVDFDDNDKLALDGQRLLLKTGVYWAHGSTYETEYKSNTKIELKIENAYTYFIVTNPDGSRTWYGSSGTGTFENAVSLTAWYIVKFEDVYGNYIKYNYTNVTYNSTNQLYIDNITFSGNQSAGVASQNKIVFKYRNSRRVERDYIKGQAMYASKILETIEVYANNAIFRKYIPTHIFESDGYERVETIQEFNAQNEPSNPVVFEYYTTPISTSKLVKNYTNNLDFDDIDLGGDFDGDGKLDFIKGNLFYNNLFVSNTGNAPITLPFSAENYYLKNTFAATTLLNNKLNQFQSVVYANKSNNSTLFKIYNYSNEGSVHFLNSYDKQIDIQNLGIVGESYYTSEDCPGDDCHNLSPHVIYTPSIVGWDGAQPIYGPVVYKDNCNESSIIGNIQNYYEGDFNGDGISEVLIVNKNRVRHSNYIDYVGIGGATVCDIQLSEIESASYYILDLNPSKSTVLGTSGYVSLSNLSISDPERDEYILQDFNGDGKTDIMVLDKYLFSGTYKIFGLKQLNAFPWVETEELGQGILDEYSSTKQILFGDYNGDGKVDIMLPDTEGGNRYEDTLWHIYYSNPKAEGGGFFKKESHNIVEYRPNTSSELDLGDDYKTQIHLSSYYAMDVNKDGKSDIVRVWRKYYQPHADWWDTATWTINDHDTRWRVTAFTNNIGNTSLGTSVWPQTYDSVEFYSPSPDLPIPLASNYRYAGANTDLVIVRGHTKLLEYYQFNKDFDSDNRLKSVMESNGNISQTIGYLPMMSPSTINPLGDPATDFYSSANSVTYPNIEMIKSPTAYLVSKVTATINGVSKFQDFRYRGFVSNFDYGTVGFIRTSRSSWYLMSDEKSKIWTTQHNDVNMKGANTITWSSMNPATVFSTVPDNLLSTKTNVFDIYTNPTTKVYNVLLKSQTTIDAISGIKSESTFTYDGTVDTPDYFGLQMESVSKQFVGASLQGTTTTTSTYENNSGGTGADYYIGRPKTEDSSTETYMGDTRNSGEVYNYTGKNLTQVEKRGHNTYPIVEDMTYDQVGNLLTKTISAPTALTPIAPRMITDEYDVTKRFVKKKIDNQNFVTLFEYNTLGQVKKSTNYLGVVMDYTYDNWGKLKTTKTTGVSTTPLETTISYDKLDNGGYILTSHNNVGDNAKSITQYDVLGRVVMASTKGFANNSMIFKRTFYDGLGRKVVDYEPSFSNSNKATTYEYDYLQRPIKVVASTGRIQRLTYEGLTTTSDDDGKTTTATVDALGNKIKTTDPGGTINFTYYANGQLKESNYGGHKVSISIDGWGNKISMTDPNAGTYSYTYDAFGQMLTETTPKGTTTNKYDDFGKLEKKIVSGESADFVTDYSYNAFSQLETEISKTSTGVAIDNFTYSFDSLHRLQTSIENNSSFNNTTAIAYDTFGRAVTETKTTQEMLSGMSSTLVTKYNFNTYNGIMDKLTDGNNAILWQLNTANEKMQSLTETLGNGVTITNSYSGDNYFVSQKHVKSGTNILNNTYDFNPVKGTLNNRQNLALGTNETFTYDNLDRLTTWTNPLNNLVDSNAYDNRGRITNNNKLGTVNYNPNYPTGIYRKQSIDLTAAGKTYYENLPKQVVSYTMFKSPIAINESDKGSTTFIYNSHLSRQSMNYGYQIPVPGQSAIYTKTKLYTDDGTVEILKSPTTVTIRTYIGGDAYSAPLYIDKTKTIATGIIVDKKYYLHRDYLGSIVAISDLNGGAVERRQFDAWGNLAKLQQNGITITLPTDGTGAGLMMLDRGYTSHEHLAEVGLIQMNGRLYDPVLRSFLMPDNFIQQPENTQNYNRYSYCLNNPLLYTDPSGEFIPFLLAVGIGAAVAAATYTLTAVFTDVPFTAGGLIKATFIGAAVASVTFGIGCAGGAMFTVPATGFWNGALQGAIIGSLTGAGSTVANSIFTGSALTLKAVLGGMVTGAFIGGAIGGITAGINASKEGLNFWSGDGDIVSKIEVTTVATGGQQYSSNSEMRADYDATIGATDGISLEQVEDKLNTTVSLASKNNVPVGSYLSDDGYITYPAVNGQPEVVTGGVTSVDSKFFSRSSVIRISPYTKGISLPARNLIFKHEFMHAWHWRSGITTANYKAYSERATSSFSLQYSKAYNLDNQFINQIRASGMAEGGFAFPQSMSWRNFDKIIPTWIK